ncbi:MAG: hypothetical protein U5L76_01855 [Patescibacteria group bacterium]|nr:hypothetical protein [Patescibacteria group bacterium]
MFKKSPFYKIKTSVPLNYAQPVREAMSQAGAGKQGNYINCSGSYSITGRFTPIKGAKPTIGSQGKEEVVKEEAIEMLCHKNKIKAVIKALKKAHPYEEPPIDIFERIDIK